MHLTGKRPKKRHLRKQKNNARGGVGRNVRKLCGLIDAAHFMFHLAAANMAGVPAGAIAARKQTKRHQKHAGKRI